MCFEEELKSKNVEVGDGVGVHHTLALINELFSADQWAGLNNIAVSRLQSLWSQA